VGHNCGIVVAHTLHDTYNFLKSLQHRGREVAGLAAIGETIDVIKWIGTVNTFDLVDLIDIFPPQKYHTFFGHVRYATRGRKDKILEDGHPHVIGGEIEDKGNHIIIRNCRIVGIHNGQVEDIYFNDIDQELLKTGCDTEALLHYYDKFGEKALMEHIPGAFTMAIADKKRGDVLVLRDRTGIKPGVIGEKDGLECVVSENIALLKNHGEFIEELDLGTIYHLEPKRDFWKEQIVETNPKKCKFELDYLAHQGSTLNDLSVRRVRLSLGKMQAEEFVANINEIYPNRFDHIDFVTYLPRCPIVAAKKFASQLNLPFKKIFYKMRGERSFQGSTASERKNSIEENLFLNAPKDSIKDKVIIVIDDSMVRGNNIARARHLLYDVGKVKDAVYFLYTSPIGIVGKDGVKRGCKFGVDMPPEPAEGDEFIARDRSLEEISKEIRMPVMYLSYDGMLSVYEKLGMPRNKLCTFCFGGERPF